MNLNESDVLQNLKGNLSAPSIRNIYLKKARDEFNAGNVSNSAFFQTEALCLGYRCIYASKSTTDYTISPHSIHISDEDKLNDDELIKFAAEEIELPKSKHPNKDLEFQTDPVRGIESINQLCQSLPKEWTLVHLCKNFNADTSFSLKSEILTREDSIFLTVLKSTQHDRYPTPICFSVDMKGSTGYIYKTFAQISNELREKSTFEGQDNQTNKAKYWRRLEAVNSSIADAVDELKKLIGPWKCFFAGPVLPCHQKEEETILKNAKKFCSDNKLNDRQYVIISSLARQIHLLSENDIRLACRELTSDSPLSDRIRKYLLLLKEENKTNLQCSPCILIVDELLDHFFWETMNPQQEICRISSLYMLKLLYQKYQQKISDGYLKISVNNGTWIINPDKSLNHMEKRISNFLKNWAPDFDCIIGEKPTVDDIIKSLTKSEIFVYSGHGSGLQFFNGHKITKLNSDTVVLLLGCDSTRLQSQGLHSEMYGAHLYYFATLCPAVIGSLILAFDRQMDTMTAHILSKWIPSKNKFHWSSIDHNLWLQDGQIVKTKDGDKKKDVYEPRLPLIIARLRENLSQKLYIRACLVYRGLPLWNTNAE